MKYRTIMIFPQFSNLEIIQKIREKYDPLAELVSPHISIVYTFRSDLTDTELKERIIDKVKDQNPFILSLSSCSLYSDDSGYYLHLNVQQGAKELSRLNSDLSPVLLPNSDFNVPYYPHMTIGRFDSREELEAAYHSVKNQNLSFYTVVNRITVEQIGEMGESNILFELPLADYSEE